MTNRIADATGIAPGALAIDAGDADELLRLAGVAAHESGERTNAPLLCHVLGPSGRARHAPRRPGARRRGHGAECVSIRARWPRAPSSRVEVDGREYVVWRGRNGAARQRAPHLPASRPRPRRRATSSATSSCAAGHGWAFDGRGNTYKRNEFGRVDPKGPVPALTLREDADGIEIRDASEAT